MISPTKASRALPSMKPRTCHAAGAITDEASRVDVRDRDLTSAVEIPRAEQGFADGHEGARRLIGVTCAARRAVLVRADREQQHGRSVHDLDLGHLHVTEQARLGEGRPHLPREQVRRPGMTDDATGVELTGPGPGGDEGVEAIAVSVGEHPRVAPRIVSDQLVPALIELDDGVRGVLRPCPQVGRRGQGDTLLHASARPSRARVEEVPRAIVLEHRPGPRRHAFPRVGRAGFEGGPEDLPAREVGRDRVADRGVPVALELIAERPGRLQEEEVELRAGISDPEVPHPCISQSQHRLSP